MRTVGRTRERPEGELWKGLAAGLCAGLVASWTMNQFQTLWSHVAEGDKQLQSRKSSRQIGRGGGGRKGQRKQKQSQAAGGAGGDDATVKAATAISEGVFDHELTKREKKVAGPAVHYAMGATSGAIYGTLAELSPVVTMGAGLPFGAAVWLVADEAAVPALGLSKSPIEVPPSQHAYALVSHFVYGATTEIVRRAIRNALR